MTERTHGRDDHDVRQPRRATPPPRRRLRQRHRAAPAPTSSTPRLVGCPPPDAELWYFPTLDPDGADLDADARPPRRAGVPPGRRRPAPDGRDRLPHRPASARQRRRPSAAQAAATPASPACRSRASGARASRRGRRPRCPAPPRSPSSCRPAASPRAAPSGSPTRSTASPARASRRARYEERRRMIAFGHDPRGSLGTELAQFRHKRVLSSVRSPP